MENRSGWATLGALILGTALGALLVSIGMFGWGVDAMERVLRDFAEQPSWICPEPPEPEATPELCATCPWPKGESDDDARKRLCPLNPHNNEWERQKMELQLCQLSSDLAREGWRKCSMHWQRCCQQCSAGTDPVTGGGIACDPC